MRQPPAAVPMPDCHPGGTVPLPANLHPLIPLAKTLCQAVFHLSVRMCVYVCACLCMCLFLRSGTGPHWRWGWLFGTGEGCCAGWVGWCCFARRPLPGLPSPTPSDARCHSPTGPPLSHVRFAGASLGDFVWRDLNGNGVQDPTEPGLPGITVRLLSCNGTMLQSTTTDAAGRYSFTGLPVGSYRVVFVAPAGSNLVVSPAGQGGDVAKDSDIIDSTGSTACISLSVGENRTDIDAGFYPGVCVCVCVLAGCLAVLHACPKWLPEYADV